MVFIVKTPFPCFSRSSFSGTARSRLPVGANGLPCPSPSPWQTAGGRWGMMQLTPHAGASWCLDWQHDGLSVAQSGLCISPSLSFLLLSHLCYSIFFGPSPWCIFFCLACHPCISDMSTDPCGVCFHKCHSPTTFLLRLPLSLSCLFIFWLPRQNLWWFTLLSHSTWFTVTWSSLSHSRNPPEHRPDNI